MKYSPESDVSIAGDDGEECDEESCQSADQVVDGVKAASSSSETVHISRGRDTFRDYKTVLNELYKKLEGIQQFQVFTMDHLTPGVVHCRKGPHDEPLAKDLRRNSMA
ncbi:hypothetical protein JG688_00018049 [Phytophthora aleatoria]|uniref:Uncharacterized protein n=1 Tax=Phytophthora aleatoria TaxID=2496075 RepID=A0A8J5I463_9STRA|nr:hypothetical protein JG688_00018049 [Phytophthora aleatoria]